MKKVDVFKKIANEIGDLYEKKSACYGDSFGQTYEKLGIISAVTRISDKFNRLCSLATNDDIDNLGESLDDTLVDLAAYSIMTLIERRRESESSDDEAYKQRMFLCTQELKNMSGEFLFIKGKNYVEVSPNELKNELGYESTFSDTALNYHFSLQIEKK